MNYLHKSKQVNQDLEKSDVKSSQASIGLLEEPDQCIK